MENEERFLLSVIRYPFSIYKFFCHKIRISGVLQMKAVVGALQK